MSKANLLIVDDDLKSLQVLEASLKKSGFSVETAKNGRDGLVKASACVPDLVISNTEFHAVSAETESADTVSTETRALNGFDFCREFKTGSARAEIPFIFLAESASTEERIRGLELGVNDYLLKPVYINEILARVKSALGSRARGNFEREADTGGAELSGDLAEMSVLDLIQAIEMTAKSGLVSLRDTSVGQATILFKEGRIVDAEAGHLQGEKAVYRLLTWNEGQFKAVFRRVRRKAIIEISSQELLVEGMQYLERWNQLRELVPGDDASFEVVSDELWECLADVPDEANPVLRLLDGHRTLAQVVDEANIGDLQALEIIGNLYRDGLVVPRKPVRQVLDREPTQGDEGVTGAETAVGGDSHDGKYASETAASEVDNETLPGVEDPGAISRLSDEKNQAPSNLVLNEFNSKFLERLASQPLDNTLPSEAIRCFSDEKHQPPSTLAKLSLKQERVTPAQQLSRNLLKSYSHDKETEAPEGEAPERKTPEREQDSPAAKASLQEPLDTIVTDIEDLSIVPEDASPPDDWEDDSEQARLEVEIEVVAEEPSLAADPVGEMASLRVRRPRDSLAASGEIITGNASVAEEEFPLSTVSSAPLSDDSRSADRVSERPIEPDSEVIADECFDIVSERIVPVISAHDQDEDDEAKSFSPSLPVAIVIMVVGAFLVWRSLREPTLGASPGAAVARDLVVASSSDKVLASSPTSDAGTAPTAQKSLSSDAVRSVVLPPTPDLSPSRAALPAPPQALPTSSPPTPSPPTPSPQPVVSSEQKLRKLLTSAKRLQRKGDRLGALQLIDAALDIRKSTTALLLKAETLLALGDSAAALTIAQELTSIAKKRAHAWRIRGLAAFTQKDFAQAKEAFSRYLELKPDAVDAPDVRELLQSL